MKKINKELKNEKEALAIEVSKVQEEMAATLNCFQDVMEPELLDYYTYSYKANEVKHSYLMKKLKAIYYKVNDENSYE